MRVAHISDFHYTVLTWNPLRLCSKRFFGHFNWIFRRDREFSPTQIDPLIDLFQDLKVDLVLLGGDFTTTSLPEEFQKANAFVSKLSQPWIAIPGNHDHYTHRSHRQKRYYQYFTNQRTEPFSLTSDQLEAHSIAPGWWVVALDTSQPTAITSSEGFFSPHLEAKLEKLFTQLPTQDRVILFNHYPFLQNDIPQRNLTRGEALEALIRRHPQICLYLHGHTHRHILADLQSSGLPLVSDSGSCTQGPRGSWNLIDLESQGCSVTVYRWNRGWYLAKQEAFTWKRHPDGVAIVPRPH